MLIVAAGQSSPEGRPSDGKVTAGIVSVDVVLDNGSPDHTSGGSKETQSNPLDWREVDASFAESWVKSPDRRLGSR